MRGLAIILLIIIFLAFIWPSIARWLRRKAMERAEDYLRSSMGMPPREKKGRGRTKDNDGASQRSYYYRDGGNRSQSRSKKEPLIPKEYAEDVEFTETIDYSSSTETKKEGDHKFEYYHESQVTDVEWVEVKKSRSK